ncbi:hypothetical protein [Prevotella dentasini]|uniref:hypothetical protein n=1 Tax=Prevotella dentasini TaxID=589537 RepID=UPI00046AE0EE|nr:hypothetical protein [Prevotella dentasini]
MDYKYIEQLLERYWRCETSLQEEEILRSFFSQENVPADLLPYQSLFAYAASLKTEDVLGDDFDQKILNMIEEEKPVKARIITMRQRLMPLFKAAAIVAIVLTIGNAMQGAFDSPETQPQAAQGMAEIGKPHEGPSVAKVDSARLDSVQNKPQAQETTIIK